MKLNLYLYKDNKVLFKLTNQLYNIKDNKIIFDDNTDHYEIYYDQNQFTFKKENQDQIFKIDYQKKEYNYLLKEIDSTFDIECTYQNYTLNDNIIKYEYLIESDEQKNSIIIKLEKESVIND